ncbi:MAG: MFS transporter [Acidobacteria bacterium]|nr:MFS transporter [Acidobacteriota bacterium]
MMSAVRNLYRDAFSGLPREVWLLAAGALINRAGTMVLPFMSLYLTTELAFSKEKAGWILLSFGMGSIAGSWLGGWMSGRIGAVRVQYWSLVLACGGFLAVSQLHNFWPLFAGVFLLSTVNDAFRPACMTATVELAPDEVRTRALTLLRLSVNLGMAVGPALAGVLATENYVWLFVGDAITCLAAGLFIRHMLRGAPRILAESGDGAGLTLRSPWRDGPFLVFLLIILLLGVVFMQLLITLPLFLHDDYGLPEYAIGGLIAFNALLIVLTEMILIRRTEHRPPLRMLAVGILFVGAAFALFPLGRTILWAGLAMVVLTVGEMLAFPFSNALAASRGGRYGSSAYMGLYTAAFSLAHMLAPVGGLFLYEWAGGGAVFFTGGALALLLSLACLGLAPSFRPRLPAA